MTWSSFDGNIEKVGRFENRTEDVRGTLFQQDLKRVYRDFGIDSRGNFYRRLKQDQDLFEESHRSEIPYFVIKALENPFFFGGHIGYVTSIDGVGVDERVLIPEGSWKSEDVKAYRDPRSPAQIARSMIRDLAEKHQLVRATLTYNNVAIGEDKGPENFQDREDMLNFSDGKKPYTLVGREVPVDDDKGNPTKKSLEFKSNVLGTDHSNRHDYWQDCNTDYMVLDLEHSSGTTSRVALQRIVVGEHQWTEVIEDQL